MDKKKVTAIILAAGSGKRMNSDTAKQYLLLQGKPVLYYTIKAFENSSIDEIILVVGKDEIEYCKNSIIDEYDFKKVSKIIVGGAERYNSVFCGLNAITSTDYVLIHDGARPFITVDIIETVIKEVIKYNACVVGMPSKDTIKVVNTDGIITETPNRDKMWMVQTPQAFAYQIIFEAYSMIINKLEYNNLGLNITDDAMVVESTMNYPIKMVKGSYSNIKITTPEDILIGDVLIKTINLS
ncbi:MAG: 2-C-methyl-D-erythritol 4-phosphate cytidylyltransferase [Anaerocolumna sp.]|jgi:2-C-methyl-D-erythritol 4-phosphate cytidylyltransferase|nr:2-C-methyl-D-erythritol 4-phosphate cytidylyltransferase [Anaerocolumna sp.]